MEQADNEDLDAGTESTASEARAGEEADGEQQRYPVPKVWVASLSDYNAGRLVGAWVDVASEEALWDGINSVLASSPIQGAEEWAFHDYEGFGPIRLGESEPVEDVARLANGIASHGPAFAHYAALVGWHDADQLRRFEEAYEGHFDDLGEYGESIIEAFGFREELDEAVPDLLAPFVRIDTVAFARDMELGGMIMTSKGDNGIYIFDASF